ncbi:hypothetical protein SAMN04487981_104540 [Streptomyces sp. cf386]|uniref:hypothetical protein n=1 Tax=Streptomyces sp. cf386 TaxID=1761904 RepID=UPI00087F07B7|nr:hypothetical protein [Streptomyces sp. cf386]SDN35320.1 hypothetical protein SAMN04487981_104540 [Streptomyces sp. cf386]
MTCHSTLPGSAPAGVEPAICHGFDRLREAADQGWLGEVAAIETAMAAAAQKLEAMRERAAQPSTVRLGMPDIRSTVGRITPEP